MLKTHMKREGERVDDVKLMRLETLSVMILLDPARCKRHTWKERERLICWMIDVRLKISSKHFAM